MGQLHGQRRHVHRFRPDAAAARAPWATAPALDWFGIGLMAFTVVFGTFGAYWLFLGGTQRCGAMRATMLGTSEPVTATITGVLFAGAVFTPTDLVGFAMIIIMVFLVR